MSSSQPENSSLPGHRPQGWSFLEEIAAQQGFAAIGVTPAEPLPVRSIDVYDRWLDQERNAKMHYLQTGRDARQNPSCTDVLPGASTIVVAALPYGEGAHQRGLWRTIARYARGIDYHHTVAHRLEAVAQMIGRHHTVTAHKICVDSAPLQERTLAVLAGIGTLGLNGNVIVPQVGPRVVLGAIVLAGLPAPDPAPAEAHEAVFAPCSGCRLCLEACPTGALNGDGTLDARRCLAYHTVENRAAQLDPEISSQVTTLFGCDLCTAACPRHNPDVPGQLVPTDAQIEEIKNIDTLVFTSNRALSRLFSGTTLERTGGRTLKRNAGYAANNLKNQQQSPHKKETH